MNPQIFSFLGALKREVFLGRDRLGAGPYKVSYEEPLYQQDVFLEGYSPSFFFASLPACWLLYIPQAYS